MAPRGKHEGPLGLSGSSPAWTRVTSSCERSRASAASSSLPGILWPVAVYSQTRLSASCKTTELCLCPLPYSAAWRLSQDHQMGPRLRDHCSLLRDIWYLKPPLVSKTCVPGQGINPLPVAPSWPEAAVWKPLLNVCVSFCIKQMKRY